MVRRASRGGVGMVGFSCLGKKFPVVTALFRQFLLGSGQNYGISGTKKRAAFLPPVFLFEKDLEAYLVLPLPISSSHLWNAATMVLASSGVSILLFLIKASYSGRPYSAIASWLSLGAMLSGTSLTAGPG